MSQIVSLAASLFAPPAAANADFFLGNAPFAEVDPDGEEDEALWAREAVRGQDGVDRGWGLLYLTDPSCACEMTERELSATMRMSGTRSTDLL